MPAPQQTSELVVPVAVQAMVVDNADMDFVRAAMNYRALANWEDPEPAPFQSDENGFAGQAANQGVYLTWTLPKALRHGRQQPDGSIAFRPVPNRWFVCRLFRPAVVEGGVPPAAAPLASAWVVESDYIDPTNGTSAYLDPRNPTTAEPTSIGRKVTVTSSSPWREPGPTGVSLKAVAESNPAFAAYQPFNENVFSLFDGLAAQDAGTLSYFVLGWYGPGDPDVLTDWMEGKAGGGFADLLHALNWTAESGTSTSRQSLYQGNAFGVPWNPQAAAPPQSPKDGIIPRVAVANTSVDGLTAYAREALKPDAEFPTKPKQKDAIDLLNAFQYNLLPMLSQPGAEPIIEQTIRSHWFGASQAGRRWVIQNAETPPGEDPPLPPDASELAIETAWLAELNTAQKSFDTLVRQLMASRRRLFELWWKSQDAMAIFEETFAYPWGTSQGQFNETLETCMAEVNRLATGLAAFMSGEPRLPLASETLPLERAINDFAAARRLPTSRRLKALAEPRFWSAADPVLVMSNTALPSRTDTDDRLSCRWPDELASALLVDVGASTSVEIAASSLAPFRPELNWKNLPPLASALFDEFFLLDPTNAALLAEEARQTLTAAQLATLSASMSPPNVPAAFGQRPSMLAKWPWTQPWQPLFVDWSIQWYEIPLQGIDGTRHWAFDGLDYSLVALPADPPPVRVFSGRSILTPKPSFEFKSRIDQFLSDYPDSVAVDALEAIEAAISKVDQWDFLSQCLSGLGTWLAGRNPMSTLRPDKAAGLEGSVDGAALAVALGRQTPFAPAPTSVTPPRDRVVPTSRFEGIRAGQFFINQLTIVDAFGQTLEVVHAAVPPDTFPRTGTGEVFRPILADGLQPSTTVNPDEALRFVQMPPRLIQAARLNFRFAEDAPILGWILPNHIDAGIAVYGSDGTAYGELRIGSDESGAGVVFWDPAPGSPYPGTLPAPAPTLDALEDFLATLQGLGHAAFVDFLQAVDETLWTIDPLGDRSDAILSVLVGRPLALVAADLSFELQSRAYQDPDWPYTFVEPEPRFLDYTFPVRLGDLGYRQDGLIGYFKKGDYTTFNAMHVPDTASSPYIKRIGPDPKGGLGNYVEIGFAPEGPGKPAPLVLLVDPRAGVHAQCGFLPVKEVTLLPAWVDAALARMAATFRTGPILAHTQQIVPKGATASVSALLWPKPGERRATYSWVEPGRDGTWIDIPLAPVDSAAVFPETAPLLRDGLLRRDAALDT